MNCILLKEVQSAERWVHLSCLDAEQVCCVTEFDDAPSYTSSGVQTNVTWSPGSLSGAVIRNPIFLSGPEEVLIVGIRFRVLFLNVFRFIIFSDNSVLSS